MANAYVMRTNMSVAIVAMVSYFFNLHKNIFAEDEKKSSIAYKISRIIAVN